MNENVIENRASKLVGMLFVIAIHLGLLYLAMSYKLIPPPQEALVMMVDLINPPKKEEPPPPEPEPPKPEPPKEVKLVKEKPVKPKPEPKPILAVEAPAEAPTEFVVEKQPEPEPIKEEPAPEPAPEPVKEPEKPAEPVRLDGNELECPRKSEPSYPAASRRMGEQGSVKLRLDLDESGNITSVKVVESSGHTRLDNAGMAAVKNWKCNAPTRDGKPARAIATQIFDFKLE